MDPQSGEQSVVRRTVCSPENRSLGQKPLLDQRANRLQALQLKCKGISTTEKFRFSEYDLNMAQKSNLST